MKIRQMKALRSQLASDLHDEIANNLSSINMYSRIIYTELSAKNYDLASIVYLSRITDLSKDSVSTIRDIIWTLEQDSETLHDLLLRFHDQTALQCRSADILLKFNVPVLDISKNKKLNAQLRNNLWRILKEAVTNCIRHSKATELHIETFYRNSLFGIKIKDNGQGFYCDNKKQGLGLQTMKNRVKYLKGEYKIKSEPGKGTEIKLMIKVK